MKQVEASRKSLILNLKDIIRARHKLQRQITRKYQTYQGLEELQEELKKRIKQLTITTL